MSLKPPRETMSMVLLLTAIGVVDGFEIHSKANTTVVESQIVTKIENAREVECLFGCKSFHGCDFAAFSMVNTEKHTGICSYYASLNLGSASNVTTVTTYTRGKLHIVTDG